MNRREFVQRAGAAVAGATIAARSGANELTRLLGPGPLGDEEGGWLTALTRRSLRVGAEDVERIAERTARLRRLDDFLGGAATVQMYEAEMRLTERLIANTSASSSTRLGLLAVHTEQVQQAGWAAFDAGDNERATRHFNTSLSTARQAEAPALEGNSLAYLAYQQAFHLAPDVALAEASYDRARGTAPSRVSALLLERLAFSHAVAGDTYKTADTLDLARAKLTADTGPQDPDWVFWVDETELDIMAGRCWSQLGHPLRAIPLLTSALARYDDSHSRDKALYLSWLARSYLDANEPEHAAAVLSRGIDLAAGVASDRPWARILEVSHRMEAFRNVDDVSALLERIECEAPATTYD